MRGERDEQMIETEPKVYLIAEPMIRTGAMLAYLEEVNGQEWLRKAIPDAAQFNSSELLTEFMGRLCYKSWEPGLNKNVLKIREDRGDYLLNILKSGHGSVLEHAYFSFALHDVSRVLTAELNRHRAGIAISEQSLRYVRLDEDIRFRLPHGVLSPRSVGLMQGAVEGLERIIGQIYAEEGIDSEAEFARKKTVTSAVRRIAPLGMSTEEGWTANIRAIRHVIEMRGSAHAEEEIQVFAHQLYRAMAEACPLLFADYTEIGNQDITTQYRKV